MQSPLSSAQRQEDSRIKFPGVPKGGRHQYRADSALAAAVSPAHLTLPGLGSSCPEEPSVLVSGCATGSLHPLCAGDRAWSTHCALGALYNGPGHCGAHCLWTPPLRSRFRVGGRREYAQLSKVPGPRIRKLLQCEGVSSASSDPVEGPGL